MYAHSLSATRLARLSHRCCWWGATISRYKYRAIELYMDADR